VTDPVAPDLRVSPDPYAAAHAAGLDPARMPRHVAIIMAGKGRWAQAHGWQRTRGHEQGAEIVRAVTTESVQLGIARLTLYAFSSENWSRPAAEVAVLMGLLQRFLSDELPTLQTNGVRLMAIGQLDRLPADVRRTLDATIAATRDNPNTILSLALSYGGRDELVDAARALAHEVAAGRIDPAAIDADLFQSRLYAGACPKGADAVDVVIRSAGEHRLSNFLPWQAIYAEYVSVAEPWPEFTVPVYRRALAAYQARERRFGCV
jgi:undecaprenyl diphosphate synthase